MLNKDKKSLIKFRYVSFGYKPEQHILSNINFELKPNEYVCIIGNNGCGKSTLAKILVGLIKPKNGNIFFNGDLINRKNVSNLKNNSNIIFENPDNHFIGLLVEDEIAFGLENKCVEPKRIKKEIHKISKQLNIENLLSKNINELSGGQKQLVALASVLVLKPKLLVLDEASSMLDNESSIRFRKIIENIRSKGKTCIVNITHNVEETINADRIIVLNKGSIIFNGDPTQYFKKNSNVNVLKPFDYQIKDLIKCKKLQTIIKPKLGNKLENIIACNDVSTKYKKSDKNIINNFSYKFEKGRVYGVIGSSGSGKTTLLLSLAGLIKISNGHINIKGKIIDSKKKKIKDHKAIHKCVAMSFQFPENQIFSRTVLDELMFGPKNFKLSKQEIKSNIEKYLQMFNIDKSILNRNPFELSNGQKRILSIISILTFEPEVVILDEPTSGLDDYYQQKIIKIVQKLKQDNKTIIFVSHNMNHILELADEVLVIKNNCLLSSKDPYSLFLDDKFIKSSKIVCPKIIEYILNCKNKKLQKLLLVSKPKNISQLANLIVKGVK